MEPLDQLLSRDAAWRPPPADAARWIVEAASAGAPPGLLQEARWWEAHAAALRADWDRVSALAEAGLGEPGSEREAIRLALLHAISGNLAEAQHVLSQAIQWRSGEALLHRFEELCASEGLPEAAARFRLLGGRR